MEKSTLSKGEKGVALVFLLLLLFAVLLLLVQRVGESTEDLWRDLFKVKVTGSVSDPGFYYIDRQGVHLEELKKQLTFLHGAQLPANLPPVLQANQTIFVEFPLVETRITGAVTEEITLMVRRGDPIGDYFDLIPFSDEANPSKVRGKKVTGKKKQTIKIPKRRSL